MNKIAIVTIYDEKNYGNRLQNYAVQKTLEKMGYNVETIVGKKRPEKKPTIKFYIANMLEGMFPGIISVVDLNFSRVKNFNNFTKKHIHTRYIVTDDGNLSKENGIEYDFFVVGSDQVWNPSWGGYDRRYVNMFLLFAPREKRVCFSPSIGVSELPTEWEQPFINGWDGFDELSIRESSGADIIRNLTGRDAKVLIDPTLMLDADEWLKISKKVKIKNKPYVFEYFLGERDDAELNKVAKEKGLSRLTLLDENNRNIYITNPGQFIYMISNADLVCTDSFHACVFSIIFGKPFIVYKRKENVKDMYSRIDTLLKMFGVESADMPIIVPPDVRDRVLETERNKVMDFLKRNLKYED